MITFKEYIDKVQGIGGKKLAQVPTRTRSTALKSPNSKTASLFSLQKPAEKPSFNAFGFPATEV